MGPEELERVAKRVRAEAVKEVMSEHRDKVKRAVYDWHLSICTLPVINSADPPRAQLLYSAQWRAVACPSGSARFSVIAPLASRFLSVTPQGRVSGEARASVMVLDIALMDIAMDLKKQRI